MDTDDETVVLPSGLVVTTVLVVVDISARDPKCTVSLRDLASAAAPAHPRPAPADALSKAEHEAEPKRVPIFNQPVSGRETLSQLVFVSLPTRFGGGNLRETGTGNLALFRRKLSLRARCD